LLLEGREEIPCLGVGPAALLNLNDGIDTMRDLDGSKLRTWAKLGGRAVIRWQQGEDADEQLDKFGKRCVRVGMLMTADERAIMETTIRQCS